MCVKKVYRTRQMSMKIRVALGRIYVVHTRSAYKLTGARAMASHSVRQLNTSPCRLVVVASRGPKGQTMSFTLAGGIHKKRITNR